jgi:hypothetical protein
MCSGEAVLKWTKYFQIEVPEERRRWPIRQGVRAAFPTSQCPDNTNGSSKLELFDVEHAPSRGQKLNDWLIWNRRERLPPGSWGATGNLPQALASRLLCRPATRALAVGDSRKKSPTKAAITATTDHHASSLKTKKPKCGQSVGNVSEYFSMLLGFH